MKRCDLVEVIQALDASIRNVLDNWSEGDLAAAVRDLEQTRKDYAVPALAWWESDQ